MGRVRVLLADDHRAICESVAALLEPDFEVLGTVSNGAEMLAEAQRLQPDVVVTDISMPVLDGIEAARQLLAKNPTAKVVFLTVHDRVEFVSACLAAGALGYVVKSRLTTDLVPAIHEAVAGRRFISPVLHYTDESQEKERSA
ncbi:MAG TPA: response regulator transcription factor [Candidatus Angelobacter sp.]|nr:response regulator transcription factor [Candidatus Angelobacter sp.]